MNTYRCKENYGDTWKYPWQNLKIDLYGDQIQADGFTDAAKQYAMQVIRKGQKRISIYVSDGRQIRTFDFDIKETVSLELVTQP